MEGTLKVYNTLSRQFEVFEPIRPPHVGMYVCGPTVYGEAHLGHARSAITFDVIFRYLRLLNYKVRYVRNITDVGHLENDADEGEDKIGKKARVESLEPMEVAQHFNNSYHQDMQMLNLLLPSIEPLASGHIIEQIEMIRKILKAGYAYEKNGSVYFNVKKYAASNPYGSLSGRVLEDLLSQTRDLQGQDEKAFQGDFALWIKAKPEHIMRWPSPWSDGFPGWHLECSSMSTKYLGEQFDIHGGGMDLLYPHHENEIAQSTACNGQSPAKYWLHNNMITVNGQKMGKSLGNFITLKELFSGDHAKLEQAYHPMTIRFFILQAHYLSTLDFSNEALQAAEKGLAKLMEAWHKLPDLRVSDKTEGDLPRLEEKARAAMNEDFNTPMVISAMFDAVRFINSVNDGHASVSEADKQTLMQSMGSFLLDVLGMRDDLHSSDGASLTGGLMELIIALRKQARDQKDFSTSDRIRDDLASLRVTIKDTKDGTSWRVE